MHVDGDTSVTVAGSSGVDARWRRSHRRIRQQVNVRSNFVREDPFKRWLREDGEVVGVAHRRLQHDVSDGAPILPVLRKLALDEILDRRHHVLRS